jgi:hypothetical protein
MNINEMRLELLEMAEELDGVVYDNGPMGESRPHTDKARRLRSLARELKGVSSTPSTGDFRDEPWEPR